MVEPGYGLSKLGNPSQPAWTLSAGSLGIPIAVSAQDNAAFRFGPLRAGHPTNPSNKILWVVREPHDGQPLHVAAIPDGSAGPTVAYTFPRRLLSRRDLPFDRGHPYRLLALQSPMEQPSCRPQNRLRDGQLSQRASATDTPRFCDHCLRSGRDPVCAHGLFKIVLDSLSTVVYSGVDNRRRFYIRIRRQ